MRFENSYQEVWWTGWRSWNEESQAATQQRHVAAHALEQFNARGVQASKSLMHVKQKRTRELKGWTCADGRPMRATTKPEDAASPTAFLESIILTSVTEAHEGRDVMTADTPSAFVQTELEKGPDQKKIIVRLQGAVAKMMVRCAPKVCKPHVVFENGQKSFV